MKRISGLLVRFALIFLLFMVITIGITAAATYMIQHNSYKNQQESRIKEVTKCLEGIIEADGDEFRIMQRYFLSNHKKVIIPFDFDGNYLPARNKWERIFSEQYPGEVFEKTIRFDDLNEEAKNAFATYKYEQWLSIFEKFNETFGTEYVYYLVPTDTPPNMFYIFDGLRTEKVVDGESIMEFDFFVKVPEKDYPKLWETYRTGRSPDGYDSYNNQYGKTYGYYTPLYVNGEMLGIVCADINVDTVNESIVAHTIKLIINMALIMSICMLSMLWFINHHYILRINMMENYMNEYAENKDVSMADKFDSISGGRHEISNLARRTATMIRELNDYMINLTKTSKELYSTKEHAAEMFELAHKDALTGIRNKTAYDKEIIKLERELRRNPDVGFGLVMIDLNYLKRINDTYGHEKGNFAIKKLCDIVCKVFCHSPVYRVGGDEFVVVLWGNDFYLRDSLMDDFAKIMKEIDEDGTLRPWEKISAAIGMAVFSPETDNNVNDVFKRADSLMYENKKAMRAMRE